MTRILLDTHAYFWWATGSSKLSPRAFETIRATGTDVLLSAVVPWEMATKFRIGKWPGAELVLNDIERATLQDGFVPLPVSLTHARRAGLIPSSHRDPFDRLLVAQAETEGALIVSTDRALAGLGGQLLW